MAKKTTKTPLKRPPTLKQKKLIKVIMENPWIPQGKAMEMAGYSEASQRNPADIFESPTIKDFFASDGSSVEALKHKHNQLLNSAEMRSYVMPRQMSNEEIRNFFEKELTGCKVVRIFEDEKDKKSEKKVIVKVPNEKMQLDALDMAYKILWAYKDPKPWTPPTPKSEEQEQTQRLSRASQIFQLWTSKS